MAATIIPYWLRSYHQWQRHNWTVILPIGCFPCLERITVDILEEADPLYSFVEHLTKAANDSIPRATTFPKKSNPWFDEECQEALKARRALDKRVRQSRELRGETLSAFRRSQAQAKRLSNQKKCQSWVEYVSKLSTNTPFKHVWDRVRKISGKNICLPKQYLNGKDGAAITNPKDIAKEHAAAFTDNSSAHYSATFQTIKVQEEKVKIDITSDNTEVYNKTFRLRYFRRSIMKAKRCAPGPDGIHNNLLKYLPEDTLKILKEILNKIWTYADFPHQWRAATVIPIPKPNKDHTDPLSYRPIALTSCLCKVLERMINTRLIWYLEKSGILDKSQCGLRKHRSTTNHLVSLERYLRDAFAQRQQAVCLFFDLEKAYETTWQYGIIRDLHRIGLRGRLPVFVSEYFRDRQIQVRIGTTLWWIQPRGGCSNWWCPGCDMLWTEDQWTALLHCQGHFQSTICWRPVNLFSWVLPEHHRETFTASSKLHTRMGNKEWFKVCSPQVQSHTFHCTPSQDSETPHCEDWKHTSASGGVNKVPWVVVGFASLL